MPISATRVENPAYRRLRVFSLDPSVDAQLDNAHISRTDLKLPWEKLDPGPVGEYVEVVDVDPSSGYLYEPVDLGAYLATDGLSPATGDPQFHQQMVYAIAMLTIRNFEKVIGRDVLWSERTRREDGSYTHWKERYVQRLRIYPHALRQQNAFYSPAKKALLFGYFNAPTTDPRNELPGGLVFTCLSHDIIAHETTHAILDGIHRRLLDASNPDMLAFHEAFADVVAIFQHFTLPDLLLSQIQRTRGRLDRENLLAELASQFGRATGRGGALRNALGLDAAGVRTPPDPTRFEATLEPHGRGAIVVAAIFDAFLSIYRRRVDDLFRIASGGTGVLPDGDIHPDLAKRLADEAVKAANRVLTICIRGVDYLPPVDITFGDYIRALITADMDLYPDDPRRYRLAFLEAFRNRGIYPLDVRTLSEESLRWQKLPNDGWRKVKDLLPSANVLRTMAYAYGARKSFLEGLMEESADIYAELDKPQPDFNEAEKRFLDTMWPPGRADEPEADLDRRHRFLLSSIFSTFLQRYVTRRVAGMSRAELDLLGKELSWHLGIELPSPGEKNLKLEVHAVRPTVRMLPGGRSKTELLVILTQSRLHPVEESEKGVKGAMQFKFRGGCTLIIDPEEGRITYAIAKNVSSEHRLLRHRSFLRGALDCEEESAVERFGLRTEYRDSPRRLEPLAGLHAGPGGKGGY